MQKSLDKQRRPARHMHTHTHTHTATSPFPSSTPAEASSAGDSPTDRNIRRHNLGFAVGSGGYPAAAAAAAEVVSCPDGPTTRKLAVRASRQTAAGLCSRSIRLDDVSKDVQKRRTSAVFTSDYTSLASASASP